MHSVPDCKLDLHNPISVPEEVCVDICKEKQKDAAVGKGRGGVAQKGNFPLCINTIMGIAKNGLVCAEMGMFPPKREYFPFRGASLTQTAWASAFCG